MLSVLNDNSLQNETQFCKNVSTFRFSLEYLPQLRSDLLESRVGISHNFYATPKGERSNSKMVER